MNSRVIFLDYDGVLNNPFYLLMTPQKTALDALDPHRIAILSTLCNRTKAKVVLTSTWRDDLKARKYLIKSGIPIIGATPHHNENRGLEIKQWIRDKKFTGNYIILDDECSDLTDEQIKHLVYTREGKNLGLSFKHILFAESLFRDFSTTEIANQNFIRAILLQINEELCRVKWNIDQKEYNDENPFQNTGNIKGFETNIFEVHAYDWGWDWNDNGKPQPVNFKWRDLEITWYKWFGRGINTNRPVTHDELAVMLDECLKSLWEWEEDNERN